MQDDLIERNVETLKQVARLLAGGAYYADDDECHPLYPAAVAARQFLAARIAALEADNARLMGLVGEAGEAVHMAMLELGSHGACPACINAHSGLRATLAKIKENSRVTD